MGVRRGRVVVPRREHRPRPRRGLERARLRRPNGRSRRCIVEDRRRAPASSHRRSRTTRSSRCICTSRRSASAAVSRAASPTTSSARWRRNSPARAPISGVRSRRRVDAALLVAEVAWTIDVLELLVDDARARLAAEYTLASVPAAQRDVFAERLDDTDRRTSSVVARAQPARRACRQRGVARQPGGRVRNRQSRSGMGRLAGRIRVSAGRGT